MGSPPLQKGKVRRGRSRGMVWSGGRFEELTLATPEKPQGAAAEVMGPVGCLLELETNGGVGVKQTN